MIDPSHEEMIVPDTKPTDAEAKKNREEIEGIDATRTSARGNVHSEPDEIAAENVAPPPMPH